MLQQLIQIDTQIFRWINNHNSPILDWMMWTLSQGWSWAIVLVAAFCMLTLRHEPRRWWIVLLAIGCCFLLADRISVLCFKEVVCRPRPCHALPDVNMFHTTCGGAYGFVSSHAANIAAIAMLLSMRYSRTPRRTKIYWFGILIWTWAILVMYSRPYLGKHYPGDVICGAILGIGIGALVCWLSTKFEIRFQNDEKK